MKSMKELMSRMPSSGTIRHELRQFNLSSGRGGKALSVKGLANNLGLDVELKVLPRGQAGFLGTDPFSKTGFKIVVSERLGPEARRWAVLHELGHFLMHSGKEDIFAEPIFLDRSSFQLYLEPKKEREANEFAACILFGDGALKGAVSHYRHNKKILCFVFGVSPKTLEIGISNYC